MNVTDGSEHTLYIWAGLSDCLFSNCGVDTIPLHLAD